MDVSKTIAIVAYQGVLADETEAFRFVLSRIPGARVVIVGERTGIVAGPGGAQEVEATFNEVGATPDVVAVPGGLGCHRHVEIALWLRTIAPTWLLASSTGSALLAAAGLLRNSTAATHWLAGSILERHGAHPSPDRLVVAGPIVTCTGRASAYDAALVVARSFGGPQLVERILAEIATAREPAPPTPTRVPWRRRRRAGCTSTTVPPAIGQAVIVELELEDITDRGRARHG